jgi:hypothetical protein
MDASCAAWGPSTTRSGVPFAWRAEAAAGEVADTFADAAEPPSQTASALAAMLPDQPTEETPKRPRLAETPHCLETPPPSPRLAPMLSEASQRHFAHVSQLYLHGGEVTDKSMPLPARQSTNAWEPGVSPHAIERQDFSAAAHLLRVFLGEFRRTKVYRERIGYPKPKLLTAEGETKFIGLHGTRLIKAAGGGWFRMTTHDRLAIFNTYLRRGMSTAPARDAGLRMVPAAGELPRRCDWFTSRQAANFYITEEETGDLLAAVAAVYAADMEALSASAQPAR